ncbi:MAG TPA: hypothetical protein P5121_02575 [Caldilineaceae bacterium]|nr:hypothetical protein [Caldilineaceae bacterium]
MSLSTTATLAKAEPATTLQSFGRAKLADYFADFVIYRNLEPLDRRIKGLKSAGYKMGLNNDTIPRKFERDYARAAMWFATEGQRVRKVSKTLSEMLFIGDTLLNDGQAYKNLRALSEWKSACFIGADRLEQDPNAEIDEEENLYHANRWALMGEWMQQTAAQGFHLDQRTVVIVDIDKTALGAKGRNDQVIDKARIQGIFRTMDSVLGKDFDQAAFERQYSELNRARYHTLTADNQDFLAYICLVLNTGLIKYDELLTQFDNGSLHDFEQFVRWVDSRMMGGALRLGEPFRQVHEAVGASLRIGDPTPFKRFRRQEFLSTAAHMGHLPVNASVEQLLDEEITFTQEVRELSAWLQKRGCLLICLSDKPQEASCPERPTSDFLPLHQIDTHCVGTSIQAQLDALT